MSYEGHEEDKAKVLNAFGGARGLIDSGVPSVAFLITFNLTHNLNRAVIAALSLSLILALARLVKRETLQHSLSGLLGVAVCAVVARHSGKAADFYLPSLYINVVYAAVYSVANVIGWPVFGLLLGPILGENLAWRKVAQRKKAYIRAGWLWVGLFVIRLLIQYPLYKTNHLNILGTVTLALGYPGFLFVSWGTWLILRKVPTIKVESTTE